VHGARPQLTERLRLPVERRIYLGADEARSLLAVVAGEPELLGAPGQ